MPRSLSANNQTNTAVAVTKPTWLIEIGFSTPLRLSSRGDFTYGGNVFASANLEVSLGNQPIVSLFNDRNLYSPWFINEGAGKTVVVYQVFGNSGVALAAEDIYWHGVTAPWSGKTEIQFALKTNRDAFTPKIVATDQIFSRLPAEGTVIQTRSGQVTLTRQT
jgi:hypothetical protein